MIDFVRGEIRGRIIELDDHPGVAEGSGVEVAIRTATGAGDEARVEAIRRTAGAMADAPDFAAMMDDVEK